MPLDVYIKDQIVIVDERGKPANEIASTFCALVGKPRLNQAQLQMIKELGFVIAPNKRKSIRGTV